ncbi:hypothetical protein BES08_27915 (plasmid) [Novosphingobium resinovorum]|uniref:Uncharacterized protein n=1 Tax=Novosphingobium resinovorum TaxID=158500 RepID=A0A1D8AEY2_9SPHN|nr:hypothetical protein BES08_27915 [Novosphingobium resinovorum]
MPQDASITLLRIEHTRKFNVAIVAGYERGPLIGQLVQEIEHASDAHAERSRSGRTRAGAS